MRWASLLPSNDRKRSFKCAACGQLYDLSDGSKVASILGGVLSLGPGVLLFGNITRGHPRSPIAVALGTLVIIAVFAVGSIVAGRVALGLVRK
ncbi:MAG TPA: hypothetical protein VH560_15185 [Polyangia bacterium]|nr:hypothetical protein [Polyangia bacterium]